MMEMSAKSTYPFEKPALIQQVEKDPISTNTKQQLEQIDEQPEFGNTTYGELYEMKRASSTTDIERLCGGCFRKQNKDEVDSVESLDQINPPNSTNRKDKVTSNAECEMPAFSSSSTKACKISSLPLKKRKFDDSIKCDKIQHLEEQLERMHIDLNHVHQNMISTQERQKMNILSERLDEVNVLLKEMKCSCLQLQQIIHKSKQDTYPREQSLNLEEHWNSCHYDSHRRSSEAQCPICAGTGANICYNIDDFKEQTGFKGNTSEKLLKHYERDRMSLPYNVRNQDRYQCPTCADTDVNIGYHIDDFKGQNPKERTGHRRYSPKKRFKNCEKHRVPLHNSSGHRAARMVGCECRRTDAYFPFDRIHSSTESFEWTLSQGQSCVVPQHEDQNCHSCHCSARHYKQPRVQNHSLRQQPQRMSVPNPYIDIHDKLKRSIRCCSVPHNVRNQCIRNTSSDQRVFRTVNIRNSKDQVKENCIKPINHQYVSRKESKLQQQSISSAEEIQVSLSKDSMTKSNETIAYIPTQLPLITKDLSKAILQLIGNIDHSNIALTVILQSNNLYHINISLTHTGQSLGDVYTTEFALQQAESQYLFEQFLTFFVLSSNNNLEQQNRILGHSFEFINMENSQARGTCTNNFTGKRNSGTSISSKQCQTPAHAPDLISESKGDKIPEMTHIADNEHYNADICDDDRNRLKAGKGFEDAINPNDVNKTQNSINDRDTVLVDNYDNDERMQKLEQKVQMLHQELTKINEKLVPQEKWKRFQNLIAKLKDLYLMLQDLRQIAISNMGSKHRERISLDRVERSVSPRSLRIRTENENKSRTEDESAECQQFSVKINGHPTLVEKYLLTMKDFRTDADLRRRRLEEKRLQKQKITLTDNEVAKDVLPRRLSNTKIKQFIENIVQKLKDVPILRDDDKFGDQSSENKNGGISNQKSNANGKHSDQRYSDSQTRKCLKFEWDTTPIPPIPPSTPDILNQTSSRISTESFPNYIATTKNSLEYLRNSVQTATSETQTDFYSQVSLNSKNEQNNNSRNSYDFESPLDTNLTVRQARSNASSRIIPNVSLINSNLRWAIENILNDVDHSSVALSIVLEENKLYHINISEINSGKSLACFYATEQALQQAQQEELFTEYLTFFIVNHENTLEHSNHLLGHSFEIIHEHN